MTQRRDTPQCWFCKYFDTDAMRKLVGAMCIAFPDDIPEDIFYNQYDHTQPYPGDRGIQFETEGIEVLQNRLPFQKNTPEEVEARLNNTLNLLSNMPPHFGPYFDYHDETNNDME